jgi:hypothetical protein
MGNQLKCLTMGHHEPATGPRFLTARPFERDKIPNKLAGVAVIPMYQCRSISTQLKQLSLPGDLSGSLGPAAYYGLAFQRTTRSLPFVDYLLRVLLTEIPLMMSPWGGQARRQSLSLPPCPPRGGMPPMSLSLCCLLGGAAAAPA